MKLQNLMTWDAARRDAELKWADDTNKATDAGAAAGNLLDVVIPEYGKLGDLTKKQLKEIATRMQNASDLYQTYGAVLQRTGSHGR